MKTNKLGECDLNKYISDMSKLLIKDIPINRKFKVKNNRIIIKPRGPFFDSHSISYIANFFKNIVEKYRYMGTNIILDLTLIEMFNDKNTYLFLDLLIYYLLYNSNDKMKLYIKIDINLSEITHNGLINATFMRVLNNTGEFNSLDSEAFINKYTDFLNGKSKDMQNVKTKSNNNYYRKIITKHNFESITESKIATEISYILEMYYDTEWVDDVVEAISEIISNAYSHNNEFILIDIDIHNDLKKKDNEKDKVTEYSALNISIINLGRELLYGTLKKNIIAKKYSSEIDVYNRVYKAYNNHKYKFDEYYTENHFFAMTAFQKKVTTRNPYVVG